MTMKEKLSEAIIKSLMWTCSTGIILSSCWKSHICKYGNVYLLKFHSKSALCALHRVNSPFEKWHATLLSKNSMRIQLIPISDLCVCFRSCLYTLSIAVFRGVDSNLENIILCYINMYTWAICRMLRKDA